MLLPVLLLGLLLPETQGRESGAYSPTDSTMFAPDVAWAFSLL